MSRKFPFLFGTVLSLLISFMVAGQEIAEIQINGLDGELQKQAIANITVARELSAATTPRTLDRRVRQAVTQIDNALKVNGYYSAEITPHVLEQGEKHRFRFEVVKGEPVRIGNCANRHYRRRSGFQRIPELEKEFPVAAGRHSGRYALRRGVN